MSGRQREIRGVYARRLEADAKPGPSRGIAYQVDDLMLGPELDRHGVPVNRCDDDRNTLFPQSLGVNILGKAPIGRDPFRC